MTERVPCKTPGCTRDILPSTAADTGGYCMPCVQAKARVEHQEYVRKNRREVDLFAGITDAVEIINIFHKSQPYDPLIQYRPYKESLEEVYLRLTPGEQQRLVAQILGLFEAERTELAQSLLLELAAFTSADITAVLRWQAEKDEPYFDLPYRLADAGVRNVLIRRLEGGAGDLAVNHILCALSWIGDASVVDLFARWRRSPPSWRKQLHIPPEQYGDQAGWELTPEGRRRDLYVSPAYALVPPAGRASSNTVKMGQRASSACAWCGQALTILFDLDRTDSRLQHLPWPLSRLKVGACIGCTCYGTTYCRVDEEQNPVWSELNRKPDYLPEDPADWEPMPVNPFMLGKSTRAPYYAAHQFLPTTFSQVGGLPTWIQDAGYPTCLACRRKMIFIAQLSNDELPQTTEGTYYAFACADCRLTATTYQQT